MDIHGEVVSILDDVLSLDGRGRSFTRETALLGAIPELDSMAVVALITSMEEWQRMSRNTASTSGSRSPETMARIIRMPVAPVISDTT